MTVVYFIRHAEAMGNINRVFQGFSDEKLSPNGYKQLEKLAKRCQEYPFEAVYASPLLRTRLTAIAANTFHGCEIVLDPRLMEINGGGFEGVAFAQLGEKFPQEYDLWHNTPHLFVAPGGESMAQVQARMVEAVREIVSRHPNQTICIVSHGCALRNYLCHAFGWEHSRMPQVGWCDNTAVSCVEYDEKLSPTVVFHHDNSHLGELSTLAKQDWWRELHK